MSVTPPIPPLTPADCDVSGFDFMPLKVIRLRGSDFTALSTGDEFKAGVLLWGEAWLQVPAASLPDDDRILAKLCGYSLAEFITLRQVALRGWIKCADGRLYHPLIADFALAAFAKSRNQSARAASRWSKAKQAENAVASNGHSRLHEKDMPAASKNDAVAMQLRLRERGTETSKEPRSEKPTALPPHEPTEFD